MYCIRRRYRGRSILSETLQLGVIHCCRNSRHIDLRYLPTHATHLMNMAIVVIARLVFGTIHQTVSHHEPQLDEEMHCIIERSSAHPEVSLRELSIQLFKSEVPIKL